MERMEEIKVMPPGQRRCMICAGNHAPDQPHDRDSLYYQNWFYRRHRRFPTWRDAMGHCRDDVKSRFTAELAKRGVSIADDGRGDG